MPTEIRVGVRREIKSPISSNPEDKHIWDEGIPANFDQLAEELATLQISGVRTYAILGRRGERLDEVTGVYPWAADAPAGEYHHIDLLETDCERIRQAILAHVPVQRPDPDEELQAAIASATTFEDLKSALLGLARRGRVGGRPV